MLFFWFTVALYLTEKAISFWHTNESSPTGSNNIVTFFTTYQRVYTSCVTTSTLSVNTINSCMLNQSVAALQALNFIHKLPCDITHSLTCVRPDVSLEQPRSWESFPAYFTNTRQRVSPDVHFESPQAHILLLAVFTTERFPRLRVAVQLFMLEQSRVRGVGLATQTTLELLCLHAVRVCQLGKHLLVFITPRAFGAAVVFGWCVGERWGVSGDGREVTGERWQRQAAGRPHRDGAVRCRAQDLRLWDDGQGKAPVDVWREKHWKHRKKDQWSHAVYHWSATQLKRIHM